MFLCNMNLSSAVQNVPGDEAARERNRSGSLRRALSLLEALIEPSADGRGLLLTELAEITGVNKATLLRLSEPLIEAGLVARDAKGRFALGVGALRLGEAYLAGVDLRSVARPILEELVADTGETAHLVVFDEPYVVYLDKVDSPSAVRMHSRVGGRMPLYCTAAGKAMLAWLPPDVVDRVLELPTPPRTEHTLTSATAVRADLEVVRSRGWSLDDVENEAEIRCVGAAVFGRLGEVVAACSLSGPDLRITAERARELGPRVRAAADAIGRRLGAAEP
jgi:DNA-binding IclR family transcriptional regulator